MTELEFRAARMLAARTRRPDTTFAVIVALCCVEDRLPAARLAQLVDVHRSGISLVAKELEGAGVLVRTWSASAKNARRRGRERFYSLSPTWLNAFSFASPTIDVSSSGDMS